METIRVEDTRIQRLIDQGWSQLAAERCVHNLAVSTRYRYTLSLKKCRDYCVELNIDFPPASEAVVADFLVFLCNRSKRPKSQITNACAALSWYYVSAGLSNPTASSDISNLRNAFN